MTYDHSPDGALTIVREGYEDAESADERSRLTDSISARQIVGSLNLDAVADMRVNNMVGGTMIGFNITVGTDSERDLSPRDVAWMAERFATPPAPSSGLNFDQAQERLLDPDNRLIVIAGDEGTGRTMAAKALLARVIDERDVSCAHLPLGGANHFPRHRLAAKKHSALLLALPTDEDDFRVSSRFGADLSTAVAMLRENECYLIVISTREQWQRISIGAPDSIVWYSQPADPLKITELWLTAHMSEESIERWIGDSRIKKLLDGQSPQDAVDIAALIRVADEAPASALDELDLGEESSGHAELQHSDVELNRRVMSVAAARSNWQVHLLKWHKLDGRTALERNFMLAVAALPDGIHVSEAYESARLLCRHFGERSQEPKGQQGPGVIEMAQAIGAQLGVNRMIEFKRPGWADAVLRYFWIDRPDLTSAFISWLADIPLRTKARQRSTVAEHIGERIMRLASDQHDIAPLSSLFKSWSSNRELWDIAADLCAKAAEASALEPLIHSELLVWSKSGDKLLRRLVVNVCASRYGSVYPEKALVRLAHAAAADDPELDDAVIDAIDKLWQLPFMQATVFKRLSGWTKLSDSRADKARRTFARLAALAVPGGSSPQLLEPCADGELLAGDDLAQGWRSLLRHSPDLAISPISRWLDSAADVPAARGLIFKHLRAAVDPRGHQGGPDALNNLHLLVRDWERRRRTSTTPDESTRVKEDLEDLLDEDWKSYRAHHHETYTSAMNGSGKSQ